MLPSTAKDAQLTNADSTVDPIAVYSALWQDEETGYAVLKAAKHNDDFRFLSANRAIASLLLQRTPQPNTLPAANLIGSSLTDTFSPSIAQQFRTHCQQCCQTRQPASFEVCLPTKLDEAQWWKVRLRPVLDPALSSKVISNDTENGAKDTTEQVDQLVLSMTDISQFKQTEARLKSALADARTIFDHVQEAIFIHDFSGKIIDVNEQVLTLYQVTREEALRYSIAEEYAIEETPVHLLPELWERALQGERIELEWPSHMPNSGSRLDLEVILQKISLSGQERLIACVRDITERKKIEAKQNRLLNIIESTPDLVGIADAAGKSLYINQSGQQILGISESSSVGLDISESMPERLRETFATTVLPQAIAQGSWSGEWSLLTRAGKELPVSQVLIAHTNEAGVLEYIATIMRDISKQKAVEDKLRDREQFLGSIYDGANIAIFAWDLVEGEADELRCSGWNPTCEAATGMTAKSVLGKTPFEVFGPEQGAAVADNNLRCARQNQPIVYEENIIIDDLPTWWATKLNPIADSKGQIYRIVGTTTNITELKLNAIDLKTYSQHQTKQTEALSAALSELKSTQSQIVQSEKMSSLGQMVAGIAHEINNPVNFIHANVKPARSYANDLLALIDGYRQAYPEPTEKLADMLEDFDVDFIQKDFIALLDSMKVGTERIREIVLSLRNFSRLDEAESKTVDLHEGIDSTLVILSHKVKTACGQKPIEIVKDYQLATKVDCYPGQLNQAMLNILSNAMDALAEVSDARICISTRSHADQAIITISDNGPGIPDTVQARIFDPFFTTKPVGKGTGMGLAISYKIVTDKHEGKLSVRSLPTQGTEFTIELPLKQGSLENFS